MMSLNVTMPLLIVCDLITAPVCKTKVESLVVKELPIERAENPSNSLVAAVAPGAKSVITAEPGDATDGVRGAANLQRGVRAGIDERIAAAAAGQHIDAATTGKNRVTLAGADDRLSAGRAVDVDEVGAGGPSRERES